MKIRPVGAELVPCRQTDRRTDVTKVALINKQPDPRFQCINLFHFSTCFEQPCARHQDSQLYQYNIWYMTHCPVHRHLHRVTYQMLYWYNWLSWWWAPGYSKHVEKWNKYIEKSASSWLLTRIVPRCTVNEMWNFVTKLILAFRNFSNAPKNFEWEAKYYLRHH
jgi:hypothetical protein